MLDFIFIVTIFLEIILTSLAVLKLLEFEKRVRELNKELFLIKDMILEINTQLKQIIVNINKIVSIFTNKKLVQLSKIIPIIIDSIQIIILIKSLNLSKGLKSLNFETIKKIFMAQITKTMVQKLFGC